MMLFIMMMLTVMLLIMMMMTAQTMVVLNILFGAWCGYTGWKTRESLKVTAMADGDDSRLVWFTQFGGTSLVSFAILPFASILAAASPPYLSRVMVVAGDGTLFIAVGIALVYYFMPVVAAPALRPAILADSDVRPTGASLLRDELLPTGDHADALLTGSVLP